MERLASTVLSTEVYMVYTNQVAYTEEILQNVSSQTELICKPDLAYKSTDVWYGHQGVADWKYYQVAQDLLVCSL